MDSGVWFFAVAVAMSALVGIGALFLKPQSSSQSTVLLQQIGSLQVEVDDLKRRVEELLNQISFLRSEHEYWRHRNGS